ncbi:hypothetical protein NDU88_004532 [Pleurodeles waltl]|uniref:Uncharacterized protein n=1 Tax=Pleurodeles waltl TaxID=8319 RepID=A0AAV7KZR2_PLEWA|nr:hypothetical protein NDU88_004532 [Pleurodeles waltl]
MGVAGLYPLYSPLPMISLVAEVSVKPHIPVSRGLVLVYEHEDGEDEDDEEQRHQPQGHTDVHTQPCHCRLASVAVEPVEAGLLAAVGGSGSGKRALSHIAVNVVGVTCAAVGNTMQYVGTIHSEVVRPAVHNAVCYAGVEAKAASYAVIVSKDNSGNFRQTFVSLSLVEDGSCQPAMPR